MKLPKFIPTVPKPLNPAYQETWDEMSDNEKRWSFLIDMVVIGTFLCIVFLVF